MTTTQLYWLTRLDAFREVGYLIVFIIGLATVIVLASFIVSKLEASDRHIFKDVEEEKLSNAKAGRSLRCSIRLCIALISLLTALAFVPTTEEAAAIIVIPKIANSETVREIGQDVVELAKAWLTELKPKGCK